MDIFKSWLCTTPIAHRGFHNEELPENSLGAFENAIANNYPIELDVRITDDNDVVVFHDDSLSRLTACDGYVCNLTLDELCKLKLQKTDYTIPSFAETLKLVDGKVPLLIEIKNALKVGSLEKKVIELLRGYEGEFAVQSFNPYSMEYFKLNAPSFLRGQLSCFFKNAEVSRMKKFVLKRLLLNNASKPDFISYSFDDLPNRFVNRCSELPVLAWTIRSNSELEQVKNHCSNIIFEGFKPEI